jgi:hypothetical protein
MKAMKTLSRMMLAAAAVSVAALPVAAEAGTRASKASAVSMSAPGKGRSAKGEKQSESSITPIVIGVVATAAVIGGILGATSSKDNGQSPGT